MAETGNDPCSALSDIDFKKLRAAGGLMENRSFATNLTSAVGGVIERGVDLLPSSIHDGLTWRESAMPVAVVSQHTSMP
jgi:hypothetical protein